jgi:hypothetical protein
VEFWVGRDGLLEWAVFSMVEGRRIIHCMEGILEAIWRGLGVFVWAGVFSTSVLFACLYICATFIVAIFAYVTKQRWRRRIEEWF